MRTEIPGPGGHNARPLSSRSPTLVSLSEPILQYSSGDSGQSTGVLAPKSTHLWPAKLISDLFRVRGIRHAFHRDPSPLDTMAWSRGAGRLPSYYCLALGPHECHRRCVPHLYRGEEVPTLNSNHAAAHHHATVDEAKACSTIVPSQCPRAQPIISWKTCFNISGSARRIF